jgi:hypothetical protein
MIACEKTTTIPEMHETLINFLLIEKPSMYL